MKLATRPIAILFALLIFSYAFTRTLTISIAISAVAAAMYSISMKRSHDKNSWKLFETLPEIIDHLITGIQSGLSLTETLSNLSTRGPEISQEFFHQFQIGIHSGDSFEASVERLQNSFNLRAADQLFESLIFAKSLGGSELLAMLRQLGDFTRQDLALRREITAKQGWIKNSAHLSAAAPWILLLLLSAQPSTSEAFTAPGGVLILILGVAMTALAYLWMGHLSRMPEPSRIFGSTK